MVTIRGAIWDLRMPKLLLAGLIFTGAEASLAQSDAPQQFSCGGELHRHVNSLWNQFVKEEIGQNQIKKLLQEDGDVYPLYDMEVYLSNFVALNRRCRDFKTLSEIAVLLLPVFDELSSEPGKRGEKWICRGGARCNKKNGLLGREVELISLQFLGLSTSIAASLSRSETDQISTGAQLFIKKSTQSALNKLAEYSNKKSYNKYLRDAMNAKSNGDGSRGKDIFLRDREVWMLTIFANIAAIRASDLNIEAFVDADMRKLARELNNLFKNRTTFITDKKTGVKTAEIDRGFWKGRAEARYAGYEGSASPGSHCPEDGLARYTPVPKLTNVRADSVKFAQSETVGWDVSHARRLVPLLDAMENYGGRFADLYGVATDKRINETYTKAYARQLTTKVWNQSLQRPLFTNYWSGANGWYRVGYTNGVKCNTGYPPFGLSMSVLVGGYLSWGSVEPSLVSIGRAMYDLVESSDPEANAFIKEYYDGLSLPVTKSRNLNRFMFYSSLIR